MVRKPNYEKKRAAPAKQKNAKRPAAKKPGKFRAFVNRMFCILIYIGLYILCVAVCVSSSLKGNIVYEVGSICEETIVAPKDFVDEYTTNLLREDAAQAVAPIYNVDSAIIPRVEENISNVFSLAEYARVQARQLYIDSLNEMGDIPADANTMDWSTVSWETFVDKIESDLMEYLPGFISREMLVTIISMERTELEQLKTTVIELVTVKMSDGISFQDTFQSEGVTQDELSTLKEQIHTSLVTETSFTTGQITLADAIINEYVEANKVYDRVATEAKRQEAADSVEEVKYIKGQNIVQKGNVITTEQYEIIKQLGLANVSSSATARWIFVAGFILLLFIVGGVYAMHADPSVYQDRKTVLNIVSLTCLSMLFALVYKRIDLRLLPVYLPVIIGAVSLRRRSATLFGFFATILTSMIMSPEETFFFDEMVMRTMLTQWIGCTVAIFIMRKKQNRGEYLLSGTAAGLVSALIYIGYGLLNSFTFPEQMAVAAFGFASGLISGLLAVGVMPIWEFIFSLSTPTKLLELTDPSRPLLRRLMIEAPGTYHHSVMVANLAEAGADAIGADGLLARVAAYYHDVGKLTDPFMFKENQMNMPNPHDEMPPYESAQIIRRHIPDGVKLLERNRLPKNLIEIISQHHGDSTVGYFYYQATQRDGANVKMEDFRYQSKKPQTKEAGILMMADIVEAAVRANNAATAPDLKEQIEKLIKNKYDEGMFDECPITRRDILMIINAFCSVFEGASHKRVVYPPQLEKA